MSLSFCVQLHYQIFFKVYMSTQVSVVIPDMCWQWSKTVNVQTCFAESQKEQVVFLTFAWHMTLGKGLRHNQPWQDTSLYNSKFEVMQGKRYVVIWWRIDVLKIDGRFKSSLSINPQAQLAIRVELSITGLTKIKFNNNNNKNFKIHHFTTSYQFPSVTTQVHVKQNKHSQKLHKIWKRGDIIPLNHRRSERNIEKKAQITYRAFYVPGYFQWMK